MPSFFLTLSLFLSSSVYLFRDVGERDDVDEIVVAKSVEYVVHHVSSDFPANASHTTGRVDQDEHVLRAGSRLDVPTPGSTVKQVHGLHDPVHRRVLPHETGRATEILPGQRGILLVVVDERFVQLLGPFDRSDHVRRPVVDVRRDVHCRHVQIHLATEVSALFQLDRVVLCVHVHERLWGIGVWS